MKPTQKLDTLVKLPISLKSTRAVGSKKATSLDVSRTKLRLPRSGEKNSKQYETATIDRTIDPNDLGLT
jgi:hypothetical protein